MKGRLISDLDLLYELNFAREDNMFHLRLILSKCFELHRGQRDILAEVAADNRFVVSEIGKLELDRTKADEKLIERYRSMQIDANNKNAVFSLLSRVQRTIKTFYGRLLVAFPRLADHLNTETCQFQNQLRQLVLEKISGGRVGQFMEEFERLLTNRFRKELQKFLSFYSQYGCLIDKRGEKDEISLLKLEKYSELTTKQTVVMACRYYNSQLLRRGNPTHLVDLYGLDDLEENPQPSTNYGSTPHLIVKQQGFCEQFAMKMDRTLKELTSRNMYQERIITRFLLEARVRESHAIRSAKPRDKKPGSNQKRFRSNKSVNIRSISETNDSQNNNNNANTVEPKQQKPVVRQTLLEMNINDRAPLPQLSHFRLTEFPQSSFSFYRDKLNKTQLLMLFRKRFPVILKENI